MATFTNQAQISYNGKTALSNVVSGELVEALSVTKSSFGTSYGPYETVTYAVTVNNTSAIDFTGLTVTDDLGTYAFGTQTVTPLTYVEDSVHYFVNGTLQAVPTVSATDDALTITDISVPAGGNALLIYQATANTYAPLGDGGSIANTVAVSGGTLAEPVTDTLTLPFTAGPILTVTKAITPAVVNENDQLTYTLTVNNCGSESTDAQDNVILTDTLNPALSSLSVTFNGSVWQMPTNYTYNAMTGDFATVADQLSVPAATYAQDETTGIWSLTPGTAVITMTGTV